MEGLEGTHTDLWEEILLEEASAAVDADEDSEVRDYGKTCPKGFGLKVAKLRLKTLLKMEEAIGDQSGINWGQSEVNRGSIGGQSETIMGKLEQAGAH